MGDQIAESEIIAMLNLGIEPQQISDQYGVPVEKIEIIQKGMKSGQNMTSDEVRAKLQEEHGNLEYKINSALISILDNEECSSSSRVAAAAELSRWNKQEGKELDLPSWTARLTAAANKAMPANLHILDKAGDHLLGNEAPKIPLKRQEEDPDMLDKGEGISLSGPGVSIINQ